jgi:hypothetical protein
MQRGYSRLQEAACMVSQCAAEIAPKILIGLRNGHCMDSSTTSNRAEIDLLAWRCIRDESTLATHEIMYCRYDENATTLTGSIENEHPQDRFEGPSLPR